LLSENGSVSIDSVYTLPGTSTIDETLKTMVEKQCHRIIITNNQGELINMITQSRILQFVSAMVDSIPKCSLTIKELNIGFKEVVSVFETDTGYQAFNKMKFHRVGGIAVLDENGILKGSISITDLKLIGFNTEYWNYLSKTVHEYLEAVRSHPEAKIRPSVFSMLEDKDKPMVVKCTVNYTFGFVIRLFSYYKVHRIFIVDSQFHPIGVITLSDVIAELVK